MANFTEIPFCSPVKFYINGSNGIHLDQDFAVNQIKPFETFYCYKQKWQFGDSTPLQIISTVAPSDIVVYTGESKLAGLSFPWTMVGSGGALGVNLFECTINLDALIPGYYHLYFEAKLMSYAAKFVSEKLDVRAFHRNTLMFSYRNSVNDFGAYFYTGIIYNFRCEAGLMEYQPEAEGSDYVDQVYDLSILKSTPFDTFRLFIGEAPGVANYVVKILNYIFACDTVRIRRDLLDSGMLFTKAVNDKWEATRHKGWPNAGWVTTVQPSVNQSSLQYNDGSTLTPGVVTAYDIDTNLFSTEPVETVHILDHETV